MEVDLKVFQNDVSRIYSDLKYIGLVKKNFKLLEQLLRQHWAYTTTTTKYTYSHKCL